MRQYMLLIQHGGMPAPGSPEWAGLSADEQKAIYAGYKAIDETPGVTPGQWLGDPGSATPVRGQDGKTLTTDGPFVAAKEALNGYLFFEAEDLDAAIELASRVPVVRYRGAVEVRPIKES